VSGRVNSGRMVDEYIALYRQILGNDQRRANL
jgi:hypothetical protein